MEGAVAPRLLTVFYSLPLSLSSTFAEMGFNEREFNCTLSAVNALKENGVISDCVWIGCPLQDPTLDDDLSLDDDNDIKHQPVNLPPHVYEEWINGFSKGTLWPLFHSHIKEVKFEEKLYKMYQQANEEFANVIQQAYRPGDLVWIHGYHLLLLPQILRERIPDAIIGFFLHSVFPSFEIFRVLPKRVQLLEGVLGSNLIGFQTYTTASEFLQTCARLLSQDATMKEITLPSGHTTRVDVYPIGIDPNELLRTLAMPEVQHRILELRRAFRGRKIIIARDRLERNNGILQKLAAVETLFINYPEWHGKLLYLQICEPINNTQQEVTSELSAAVNELVGRINGRFGRVGYVPVELHNRRIKKEEMCALYHIADVALVTPLRAGMSTDAHDYVACRGAEDDIELKWTPTHSATHSTSNSTSNSTSTSPTNSGYNSPTLSGSLPNLPPIAHLSITNTEAGVVIISEFAGSAKCFGGALIVNPFSKTEVATALNEALTMEHDERAVKQGHNWSYVRSHTCFSWAEAILSDLVSSVKSVESFPVPRLDFSQVKASYAVTSKRLFLLDYDGTLTAIVKDPAAAAPSHRVLTILKKLCSDPRNLIYIVSGRDKVILEKWLETLDVGLCCEHGSFFREAKSKVWFSLADASNASLDWRDPVLTLMRYFEERTPGAMVEEKSTSIAWHYRNADPLYSTTQAQELMSHLKTVSSKFPVDVLWGNKVIEARPSGVNKGGAVRRVLGEYTEPDFVLCIGDDKTDEDMFTVIDKSQPNYYTVAVKRKPTQAKAFVREYRDVLNLLEQLGDIHQC